MLISISLFMISQASDWIFLLSLYLILTDKYDLSVKDRCIFYFPERKRAFPIKRKALSRIYLRKAIFFRKQSFLDRHLFGNLEDLLTCRVS